MAKQRHLPNAPIIEAIIDVRVETPPNFDPACLDTAGKALGDFYLPPEPLTHANIAINLQAKEPATTVTKQADGFRYWSTDRKYVAVFKPTGFGFSRLEKYTEWPDVFNRASAAWKVYQDIVHPQKAIRTAVRYINRLVFPVSSFGGLSEFLVIPINMPSGMPPAQSFTTRAVIADPQTNISAALTFATENQSQPDKLSILFDIDAFCPLSLIIGPDLAPDHFEHLRLMKNDIFFSHLTEKAVSLYL
jgi:uncharacterized protein (TIGR04255 family)